MIVNKSILYLVTFIFVAAFTDNFKNAEAQLQIAKVNSLADAIRYLLKFGYIRDIKEVAALLTPQVDPSLVNPSSPAQSALRMAFSTFQQYAKLPVTGEFDDATKFKMNSPRCGNKDIIPEVSAPSAEGTPLAGIANEVTFPSVLGRKKRFIFSGFKWQKTELTFRFTSFSESGFESTIIQREVIKAFEHWSNATNLIFTRTDNADADIDLRFARGSHGDVEAFDGRGITLAHAFPPGPEIGGDIHFDDDEEWSSQILTGTNFFHVAVHEIGHALGLRHSDIEEAVMYAFARGYNPEFKLHEDDLLGITSLYGKKGEEVPSNEVEGTTARTGSSPNPDTSPTTKSPPIAGSGSRLNLCRDPVIDDINAFKNGDIYAFKGAYAFRIHPDGKGIDEKRSERIDYLFRGLRYPIDAAVTQPNGKTYFFRGSQFWRYNENGKIDGKYPQDINSRFPGIPNNIDTAFVWSGDNLLYFFKGSQYWAYNPEEEPPVASNYPLPIEQWLGIPTKDIDGAFQAPDGGPTYFFKNESYWLFDDENFEVAKVDPPYPRSTRIMWFGCTSYRPDMKDLREGWVKTTVKKIYKTVKTIVDYKVDKINKLGWKIRQALPIFRENSR